MPRSHDVDDQFGTHSVPNSNVVKLHRDRPIVSYLGYPGFGDDPHPTLATALTVNLQTRDIDLRDYRRSTNPPLLHRTEEFLAPDDPRRERLATITAVEVEAGLYEHPELIGTLDGWRAVCARRRLPQPVQPLDRPGAAG